MDSFYPIQKLADWLSFSVFHLVPKTHLASAMNFFIYDVIKIGLLLILIGYFMAITRYFFPLEKVRRLLLKKRLFGLDYLLAAILGVVTPFCSCSSIPLFIGFVGAGIPLGITFAFLISSPLVNESSLYLFPSIFGLKITILYNLLGIIIAMLGGFLIEKLKMERYINQDLLKLKSKKDLGKEYENKTPPIKVLLKFFWDEALTIFKQVYPYVILGVAIGAAIHGFVPTSLVEKYLAIKKWWAVPLAVLLGVPLYANSVSVVPFLEVMVKKGMPLGTSLAFITAITTISIPEALILKKVMRTKLLLTFFGITILGIILIGWFF
ncbi:MAG: permease [Microgenomates group bacterium]|nr:permease [Microgenomates group bacterium]